MTDPAELLKQLEAQGRLDSFGEFTTSQPEALERLSRRLLEDPQRYLLKWIQALVASGATEIRVRPKLAWVEVEADGAGPPPALRPYDWVSRGYRDASAPTRHLAVGLLGAWRLFSEIHVEWGELRWRLVPEEGPDPLPLEGPAPPFGRVRLTVKRPFWALVSWQFDRSIDRLFACPVPVRGGVVADVWQAQSYTTLPYPSDPARSWWRGLLGAIARSARDGPLAAPDRIAGTYPVFFEPEAADVRFRSEGKIRSTWYSMDRLYLAMDGDDSGLVLPVEAGVALDPVKADLGVPGLRCVVSVEREGLRTDLSQFRVIEDEALEALVASLRREAPQMLHRLVEHLESWKPTVDMSGSAGGPAGFLGGFFAGGALGMGLMILTGVPAPFHFLALPGAMCGGYLGSLRWKRRSAARLRERTPS